jgi:chromosomal replication initiation ATPase DnaA
MFKESNNTYHSIPHYYVYPGLRSVSVTTARGHCSPEERLDFIMQVVKEEYSKQFEFDTIKMMGSTRETPYVAARMTFYYFSRMQCPTLTLKEIARSFPSLRQHHTTILHACTAIQNFIDTKDSMYYDVIRAIEKRLE